MHLTSLLTRLPVPSRTAQRVVGILAVVTQSLIGVTGSVVRVTGSGLGCPTWPECVPGSLVPVHNAGYDVVTQWIEFGNRLITGVVILVAALAVLTAWRIKIDQPQRRRLLLLAWTLPAGVVLQAVIGGLTVWARLEWWTVAIHFLASTPLVWFSVLLLHAFGEGDGPARRLIPPAAHTLLVALVVSMWAVLIAGTTVTGAGPHSGDANTRRLDAPIETLVQIHSGLLVVYLLVLAMFGLVLFRTGASARLWRRYGAVWAVGLAQGFLGSLQYALGVPEALVSFHVLGSALVIIATAALWCGTREFGPAAGSAPSGASELAGARP